MLRPLCTCLWAKVNRLSRLMAWIRSLTGFRFQVKGFQDGLSTLILGVDGHCHAGCSETIVNIDDGNTGGAAVQHSKQCGETADP